MSRLPAPLKTIRWPLVAPFIVLILLGAAYSAWWINLAGRIETALIDWKETQAARGITASWNSLETGGFPYRLKLDISAPEIELPDAPQAWRWTAERVIAQMLPYNLDHVIVDAPGKQTLRYTDPRNGTDEHFTLHVNADTFWASLVADGDEDKRLALDIVNVVANRERQSGDISVLAGSAAAARLQLHGRPAPLEGNTAIDAAFRGEDMTWTGFGETPWPGTDIARLDFQARLSDLPEGFPSAPERALTDALESDATLSISEFTLLWGPIDMKGYGKVKLDAKGRPEGQFRTSVGNLDGLVAALVQAGVVSEQSAGLAFAGVAALSSLQGEESGRVRLPVAMKEGVLFLGPVAAARLQPLY